MRDQDGKPLEGVTVTMESDALNGYRKEGDPRTISDGSYSFTEITAPATKVRLLFTKDGYKTFRSELVPNESNTVDVVVERGTG